MNIGLSMKSIGKDAAILTTSKVITSLISIISTMLLSRFRTLDEYGTFSEIMLVINLAVSFFLLGLPNCSNYFLALSETPEERRHFLSVYYTLTTLLCFIMGMCFSVSVPLIVKYFENEHIRRFLYFLVVFPWITVINSSVSNILVVYGKTKKLMLFDIVSAVEMVAAVLLVQIMDWTFSEYMKLLLLFSGASMIWVYVIVCKLEKPLYFSLDKQLIIKMLKYSIPIGLSGLVGTLLVETDKLIVGALFSTEQVAIFSNAAKELPLAIVASSFTAVLMPRITVEMKKGKTKDALEIWRNSTELSFIIMVFFIVALVVFAPQIITLLYSSKYLPGVTVFRVYSFILIVRVTSFFMILNSIGETKYVFYNTLCSFFINIALDYILFLLFGFVGPAIATLITHLIRTYLLLSITSRKIKHGIKELLPWRRLLIHLLINSLWGAIAFILIKVLSLGTSTNDIVYCIIMGAVFFVVYCLIEKKRVIELWKMLNI